MKNAIIFGLFLFFCVFLMNCDEAGETPDVDFSTEISTVLSVVATDTDESTYTVVLDATSDPKIQKYAANIKSIEVTQLMIGIVNYDYKDEDAEIYFNGELGFGSETASSPAGTCEISFLNITHVKNTGNFEINDCNNQLSNIASKLSADNSVKVFLIGRVTAAPVSFDMNITASVDVIANTL